MKKQEESFELRIEGLLSEQNRLVLIMTDLEKALAVKNSLLESEVCKIRWLEDKLRLATEQKEFLETRCNRLQDEISYLNTLLKGDKGDFEEQQKQSAAALKAAKTRIGELEEVLDKILQEQPQIAKLSDLRGKELEVRRILISQDVSDQVAENQPHTPCSIKTSQWNRRIGTRISGER